ncbi:hypothetical protein BaRGS_00026745 [Batillaria attramentaria]|uniref:Cullin N-terminal domain-containing protein n=1 Tax=Batillaria attramentaria TaxID=370345 RepID=A0ABD0K5C3_9CAEN
MDEPMESAEPDSTNKTNESSNDNDRRTPAPLLRPGSMVMMTLTLEDYESKYWPKLQGAIDQLLNMKPGAYIPISYEQMYSCVYKCVCKQFSERLYADLINHIRQHVQTLSAQLQTNMGNSKEFVECFSYLMHQYLQALGGIVPIFNYLNRFYVQSKLKKDLNDDLRGLFRVHFVDHHIGHLLTLVDAACNTPFAISPPTVSSLIKNLYSLDPEYASVKADLFARFIPNVLPPTNLASLDQYIEETRQMQQQLVGLPEFNSHDNSRKRSFEDDISVN